MDIHGHGTMTAGIAAGTLYGVAKEARIIAVKVLEDNGEGYLTSILLGMSYITERMKRETKIPVVINMSFATGYSPSLNRAVDALTKRNALTVSAAGNGDYLRSDVDRDACSYSPASARTTITVGAVDSKDNLSSFSNTGNCTDIYAPGVDIGTIAPNGETILASGTSFSAPHVSGAAALLYSQAATKGILNRVTPRDVRNRILFISTQDILNGVHDSNNRLLYTDVGIPAGFALDSAVAKITPKIITKPLSWCFYSLVLYATLADIFLF
ncbi:peptidase S8/S53 domain-containing protein [Phascolomyces articulosus]|uniref:Peptidase S8/S53 domain-containing protein n=1 Tax=Phascolomyces articulosus TaxID=60185 RepID=A0AAD5JST3_9FUNG|nr:peptidase S8/S53 domain-containing protein [Phascolomyces articulosus]